MLPRVSQVLRTFRLARVALNKNPCETVVPKLLFRFRPLAEARIRKRQPPARKSFEPFPASQVAPMKGNIHAKNPESESGAFNPRIFLAFTPMLSGRHARSVQFCGNSSIRHYWPVRSDQRVGRPADPAAPGGAYADEVYLHRTGSLRLGSLRTGRTGTAGWWARHKLIVLKFTWTVTANDYDFYVHFDSNNNGVLDMLTRWSVREQMGARRARMIRSH